VYFRQLPEQLAALQPLPSPRPFTSLLHRAQVTLPHPRTQLPIQVAGAWDHSAQLHPLPDFLPLCGAQTRHTRLCSPSRRASAKTTICPVVTPAVASAVVQPLSRHPGPAARPSRREDGDLRPAAQAAQQALADALATVNVLALP
jgi:hypothetical protein